MSAPAAFTDADCLAMARYCRVGGMPASQVAPLFNTTRNSVLGMINRISRAGQALDLGGLADQVILSVLDDLRGRRLSAERIGARLGLTRVMVLAIVHEVETDLARSEGPDLALRPGNRDGDLALGWWADGIWAREGVA
jgi:hypothetical protein